MCAHMAQAAGPFQFQAPFKLAPFLSFGINVTKSKMLLPWEHMQPPEPEAQYQPLMYFCLHSEDCPSVFIVKIVL